MAGGAGRAGEPVGSARLELVSGVALLREEDAVLEAMLAGWARQQLGGRGLSARTVSQRQAVVRQFLEHAGEYPWDWTAAHLDEWSADLVSVAGRAKSTIRSYHDAVRSFEGYLIAPQYRWAEECQARFGAHPARICFESNTVAHLVDYEGRPGRRPMTREELQRFFDYADGRVDAAVRAGRKGALAAYRDATVFKVMYAWGLRCTETSKLDVTDWYRSPQAPELGRFGKLEVRWGKASRGSPPRRRTVCTVMPWAAEAVGDYVVNIRPRYGFPGQAGAVADRAGRAAAGPADRGAFRRLPGGAEAAGRAGAALPAAFARDAPDRRRRRPGVRAAAGRPPLPVDDGDLQRRQRRLHERHDAQGAGQGVRCR